MTDLLLSASGVDRELLARSPRDRAKYVGMGGAVVTTSAMAALSSTFAIRMSLGVNVVVALLFGLAWGVAIFNLDRWLVSSSKRLEGVRANLLAALPRILMALIIGVVMSTPLVLRVFQPEIEAQLQVIHQEEQARFEAELRTDPRFTAIPALEQETAGLERQIAAGVPDSAVLADPAVVKVQKDLDEVEAAYDEADKQIACEKEGTCGSGRAGAGPAFKEKLERRDRLAQERTQARAALTAATVQVRQQLQQRYALTVADLEAQLEQKRGELEALREERVRTVRAHDQSVLADTGLLARIEALHRLGEERPVLELAHLALLLFLTVVECMPVLIKLMQALGKPTLYDQLSDMADEAAEMRERLRCETQQEEARLKAVGALAEVEARTRAEVDAGEAAARIVTAEQVKLAERIMQHWRREQESRIDDDQWRAFLEEEASGTQP